MGSPAPLPEGWEKGGATKGGVREGVENKKQNDKWNKREKTYFENNGGSYFFFQFSKRTAFSETPNFAFFSSLSPPAPFSLFFSLAAQAAGALTKTPTHNLGGPCPRPTATFQRGRPPEREKAIGRERGKKHEFLGPTLSPPVGAPAFQAPPFWRAPVLPGLEPTFAPPPTPGKNVIFNFEL